MPRFFALYKDGKPMDRYLYPRFTYAALAWEECEPDCDVVEIDSAGKVMKTHSRQECIEAAHRFRNP